MTRKRSVEDRERYAVLKAMLEDRRFEIQEKLRSLRFKLHGQELKNKREVANVRKDIARTMTIINEKSVTV